MFVRVAYVTYHIIMVLNLASNSANFLWRQDTIGMWGNAMRDLVTTIVFCNCTLAIAIFGITLLTIKLRENIAAIANWFDRQNWEWERLMSIDSRQSIESSGEKIRSVRQLYQQQLATVDRLRSMRAAFGVARTLIIKRRI
jgi:hypothetical protein